jgi:hypothetical protein
VVAGACSLSSAQPGDPFPQPLAPINGAAVLADPDGITLQFTRPAYRGSSANAEPSTDLTGHSARLSRDASVGG